MNLPLCSLFQTGLLQWRRVDMWYDKYYDGNGDYWFTEGDKNDKFFNDMMGIKKVRPRKQK